jgi:uncharacterized protein YjbI with pentapeptide repeats
MKVMANQKHLAKLREGVEAWNQWREENQDLEPDLREVSLRNVALQGANLRSTQLQGSDFWCVDLRGANLSGAYLQGANLDGAHLEGATLSMAQLQGAYLRTTYLQGANLEATSLQGAFLCRAYLQGADFRNAYLQGANLSEAFFDNTTVLTKVTVSDVMYGALSLADVNWGGVNLAVVDWSPLKMLGDETWVYQSTENYKATRLEDYRTAVRANRQFAVTLRNQGLDEDADRFAYRAQVLQRKVFWKQKKIGRGFFSGFLALVAGYGYRMERILLTYALAVLLFAAAYFVLGIFYEPHLSFLEAVLTSITAFHGRVFSEPFLHPGEPQLWVAASEAVAGLVIEGVFIALLTQRFFGK